MTTLVIVSFYLRIWKEMTLDPKINEFERSKLATWDYPVDDTYTKVCRISLKYFRKGFKLGDVFIDKT